MLAVADQLPRFGKRYLICFLSFTFNYVVLFGVVSSSFGTWDGLRYFIVALTEPSIYFNLVTARSPVAWLQSFREGKLIFT